MPQQIYNYIIIGGGSAGCVLANLPIGDNNFTYVLMLSASKSTTEVKLFNYSFTSVVGFFRTLNVANVTTISMAKITTKNQNTTAIVA